jgi:putative Mg2+ transporter-C (MgtC) family protein
MHGFVSSVPAVSVGYFAVRAMAALVLGAAVGLERQWRQRTAGLRTTALVATEPEPALLAAAEE